MKLESKDVVKIIQIAMPLIIWYHMFPRSPRSNSSSQTIKKLKEHNKILVETVNWIQHEGINLEPVAFRNEMRERVKFANLVAQY